MKKILVLLFLCCFINYAVAADLSVFGINIGKPLDLPDCEQDGKMDLLNIKSACVIGKNTIKKAWGTDDVSFAFPQEALPSYVKSLSMGLGAELIDGNVESIAFGTNGESVQDDVFSDLKKKFGKPTSFRKVPLQNRFNVKVIGLEARWHKNGIYVEFNGIEDSIDWGRVEISTDKYLKVYKDWEKLENSKKQAL
jgi:hypothetical protein